MKALFLFVFSFVTGSLMAQESLDILLKQADNFDKQVKEKEAMDKYLEVLEAAPTNYKALFRLTELNVAFGGRQLKDPEKLPYYQKAQELAGRAWSVDSTSADSYYLLSLTSWKMSLVEEKNKEQVEYLRKWKEYADKALSITPNHAKSLFLLGKWNFDMSKASFLKKASAKTIYGGMGKWDIETATKLMEKSRVADPYFVQNYFELAKAYEYNNQPAQELEILNKLVKLPIRTGDDAGWKSEGKKMLEQMK